MRYNAQCIEIIFISKQPRSHFFTVARVNVLKWHMGYEEQRSGGLWFNLANL